MKIVYTKKLEERYNTNPVEIADRVRLPARELRGYEFVEPGQANIEDISRVHEREHIERVKAKGLFGPASLSAGGAVLAAELALEGEPAFALIRPPGHHASRDHSWGMCFFNNMAIAVGRISDRVKKVLIIDIDLHFGDGTVNIFRWNEDVNIVNIGAIDMGFEYLKLDGERYLAGVAAALDRFQYDVVGVSAGFDTYVEDWGGLLYREDYQKIGRLVKEGAEERCEGRRFAVLEGGYHPDLRYCVKSFVRGFE